MPKPLRLGFVIIVCICCPWIFTGGSVQRNELSSENGSKPVVYIFDSGVIYRHCMLLLGECAELIMPVRVLGYCCVNILVMESCTEELTEHSFDSGLLKNNI